MTDTPALSADQTPPAPNVGDPLDMVEIFHPELDPDGKNASTVTRRQFTNVWQEKGFQLKSTATPLADRLATIPDASEVDRYRERLQGFSDEALVAHADEHNIDLGNAIDEDGDLVDRDAAIQAILLTV